MKQTALSLPEVPLAQKVRDWLRELLNGPARPSAREVLQRIEEQLGLRARWHLAEAMKALSEEKGSGAPTNADRDYLSAMLEDGSLDAAFRGRPPDSTAVVSTIDALIRKSAMLRNSDAFHDTIAFMAKFRRYSPYNIMLVRLQNPVCQFFATQTDWEDRFKRQLKEDARPMLILAPQHPLMLVYDLDQTEGGKLPDLMAEFASFRGPWNPKWLATLIGNANRYGIRVGFKPLSSTHGGFAAERRGDGPWKMRIVVNSGLDEPSRFGVLCHELAHVLLGHLGSDVDRWWPARSNLDHATVEIEAESRGGRPNSDRPISGISA
jgi:hypothetical protein